MSAEDLISSMKKLLKLHKSLYELAVKKTTFIKVGDIDALTILLKNEQKHVKAVVQIEKEREQALSTIGSGRQATMDEVIETADSESAAELLCLKNELLDEIMKLKSQNELNQQLLVQSLQFINLSLDLLQPENKEINYGKTKDSVAKKGTSIFDSRA